MTAPAAVMLLPSVKRKNPATRRVGDAPGEAQDGSIGRGANSCCGNIAGPDTCDFVLLPKITAHILS